MTGGTWVRSGAGRRGLVAAALAAVVALTTGCSAGEPVGESVRVLRPAEAARPASGFADALPTDEVIVFLNRVEGGDALVTASELGIIGEVDGRATTLLDPARSRDLLGDRSLDDVVAAVGR